MEWLTQFTTVSVNGVPLLVVVVALVQFAKQFFGITGDGVRGLALVIGFVIGLGYQLGLLFPTDWVGWFAAIIWAIGLGIASLGTYDAGKGMVASGIAALTGPIK